MPSGGDHMKKWLRFAAGSSLLALSALFFGCGGGATTTVTTATSSPGVTRTYYIAAEDVTWDYAPTGVNQITGIPFANLSTPTPLRDSEEFIMTRRVAFDPISSAAGSPNFTTDSSAIQIGTKYKKTVFVEYTSASFAVKK